MCRIAYAPWSTAFFGTRQNPTKTPRLIPEVGGRNPPSATPRAAPSSTAALASDEQANLFITRPALLYLSKGLTGGNTSQALVTLWSGVERYGSTGDFRVG